MGVETKHKMVLSDMTDNKALLALLLTRISFNAIMN